MERVVAVSALVGATMAIAACSSGGSGSGVYPGVAWDPPSAATEPPGAAQDPAATAPEAIGDPTPGVCPPCGDAVSCRNPAEEGAAPRTLETTRLGRGQGCVWGDVALLCGGRAVSASGTGTWTSGSEIELAITLPGGRAWVCTVLTMETVGDPTYEDAGVSTVPVGPKK